MNSFLGLLGLLIRGRTFSPKQFFRRVARGEDLLSLAIVRVLSRHGFSARLIPYGGYGVAAVTDEKSFTVADTVSGADVMATGSARVLGRVLLKRGAGVLTDQHRGWRQFFDAQVPWQPVRVTLGDCQRELQVDRGGYLDEYLSGHNLAAGRHRVRVELLDANRRVISTSTFRIPLFDHTPKQGLISDIDDTVMISWLPRPVTAASYAFWMRTGQRRPVPGMNRFLRELAADGDLVVYLSTGAWNVVGLIKRFLDRHDFPAGIALLSDWGPSNHALFRSGRAHKNLQLERLARELPQFQWTLVGDSGQHDPQIYRDFALTYPRRVELIAIRTLEISQRLLTRIGLYTWISRRQPDPITAKAAAVTADYAAANRSVTDPEQLLPGGQSDVEATLAPVSCPVVTGQDGFQLLVNLSDLHRPRLLP